MSKNREDILKLIKNLTLTKFNQDLHKQNRDMSSQCKTNEKCYF